MARYLVAAAGALIGFLIGGPAGLTLGWTIGSIVGTLLFPPKVPEGPRLDDLRVQISSYGAPIPIAWGWVRMTGNMFWATDLVERRHEESAKGGPSQVTYNYFANCSILFCEGPADPIEIRADGKLIWSRNQFTGQVRSKYGKNISWQSGTEDDLPPTLHEIYKGVGNVPGYKGVFKLHFHMFPLQDFGNRIPNFSVIAFVGDPWIAKAVTWLDPVPFVTPSITIPNDADTPALTFFNTFQSPHVEYNTDTYWVELEESKVGGTGISDVEPKLGFSKISLPAAEEVQRVWFNLGVGDNAFFDGMSQKIMRQPRWIVSGDVLDAQLSPVVGYWGISIADMVTGAYTQIFTNLDAFPDRKKYNPIAFNRISDHTTLIWLLSEDGPFGGFNWHLAFVTIDDDGTYEFISGPSVITSGTTAIPGFGIGHLRIGGEVPETGDAYLYTMVWDGLGTATFYENKRTVGGSFSSTSLFTITDIVSGSSGNIDAYYVATGHMMVIMNKTAGSANVLRKYLLNGTLVSEVSIGNMTPNEIALGNRDDNVNVVYGEHNNFPDGQFCFRYWDDTATPDVKWGYARVVCSTMTVTVELSPDYLASITAAFEFNDGHFVPGGSIDLINKRMISNGYAINDHTGVRSISAYVHYYDDDHIMYLQQIVSDTCKKAGMLVGKDFDTTPLGAQTVYGYLAGKLMTGRQIIEPLQQIYFFDGIETEGILRFQYRADAVPILVDARDLGAIHQGDQAVPAVISTRMQEIELPAKLTLSYNDPAYDFQQNSQYATRHRSTQFSDLNANADAPVSMVADLAKQIVEKLLYQAWAARETYEIQLPRPYLAVDPGDRLVFDVEGKHIDCYVTSQNIGADNLIKINGYSYTGLTYTNSPSTGAAAPVSNPDIPVISASVMEIIDGPLVLDSLDSESGFAIAMEGVDQSGSYPGGTVWKSSDGQNFIQVGSAYNEAVIGTCSTALLDRPHTILDRDSVLRVVINRGVLSSQTMVGMLNGNNYAIVGDELISFQNATLVVAGTYDLTVIRRGIKGTKWAIGDHAIGDRFILLNIDNIYEVTIPEAEIGVSRIFRPVTNGMSIDEAEPQQVNFTPRNNHRKPIAPTMVRRTRDISSNMTLTFVPCARLNTEIKDGQEVVIDEPIEQYRIRFYNGSTIVREIIQAGHSYEYLATDQTTDFGSPQSSITTTIEQFSSRVGYGYPAQYNL